MSRIYIQEVSLAILVPYDVEPESYCADAANELLREQQLDFAVSSCLLDYRVGLCDEGRSWPEVYREGAAFE